MFLKVREAPAAGAPNRQGQEYLPEHQLKRQAVVSRVVLVSESGLSLADHYLRIYFAQLCDAKISAD